MYNTKEEAITVIRNLKQLQQEQLNGILTLAGRENIELHMEYDPVTYRGRDLTDEERENWTDEYVPRFYIQAIQLIVEFDDELKFTTYAYVANDEYMEGEFVTDIL